MLYTLITGASSGIGQAFAKEYAKRGDNLILIARSKDKLLNLKELLESTYTIDVQIINYDLSQEKAGFTIYQIIKENGWTVNKCISSAGFATNGNVVETDWEKQHKQILVNVLALFDLIRPIKIVFFNRIHAHITIDLRWFFGKKRNITNIGHTLVFH